MQNKHQNFFLVVGVPTFGEGGGGASRVGKKPQVYPKKSLEGSPKCDLDVLRSEETYNLIGCISLAFSHCAFSSASSSFLFDTVHSCNGCICLCVSKCALKFLGPDMQNHILRICENFPYFVYSDVHLNVMHARLHTHTVCIFLLFFAMYFWGSE